MFKKVSSTLLLLALAMCAGAAHASAAATTGICAQAPNAFNFCEKFYPENEKFNGLNLNTPIITDGTRTIECNKSEDALTMGKNPIMEGPVSFKLTSWTWSECKLATGTTCKLESPAPGDTALPWAASAQWLAGGTTGPNGSMKVNTFSVRGECGTQKCNYIGAEAEGAITGKFYNANDTNKPVASTRAEIQFNKVKLNAALECTGTVEFSGVFSIFPSVEGTRNVYLSNG